MKTYSLIFLTILGLMQLNAFSSECPKHYFFKKAPKESKGVKDQCLPEIQFGVFKKVNGRCEHDMIETGPDKSLCRPRLYDYTLVMKPEEGQCPAGYFRNKKLNSTEVGVEDLCLSEIQFGIFKKENDGCKYNMIETGPDNAFCRPRILDYSLAVPTNSEGQCNFNKGVSFECPEGTYQFIGSNFPKKITNKLKRSSKELDIKTYPKANEGSGTISK